VSPSVAVVEDSFYLLSAVFTYFHLYSLFLLGCLRFLPLAAGAVYRAAIPKASQFRAACSFFDG
jgi:hypothetical protein